MGNEERFNRAGQAAALAGVMLVLMASAASGIGQDRLIRLKDRMPDGDWRTIGDPFTLVAVSRESDILICEVEYAGGCAQHDFDQSWWNGFTESYPAGATVWIVHDAHGEACEASIRETVRFDLTPMKEAYRRGSVAQSGRISIGVAGFFQEEGQHRPRPTAPPWQSVSPQSGDPQPVRHGVFSVLYEF